MKFFIFASLLFFVALISCNESPYMQGKRLYAVNCQNCHMEDGSGLAKLVPSLKESAILGSPMMSCIIRKGVQDTIRNNNTFLVREMPAFEKLSNTEVANIVNYINHSWHKDFKETHITEVEDALKSCQ